MKRHSQVPDDRPIADARSSAPQDRLLGDGRAEVPVVRLQIDARAVLRGVRRIETSASFGTSPDLRDLFPVIERLTEMDQALRDALTSRPSSPRAVAGLLGVRRDLNAAASVTEQLLQQFAGSGAAETGHHGAPADG